MTTLRSKYHQCVMFIALMGVWLVIHYVQICCMHAFRSVPVATFLPCIVLLLP